MSTASSSETATPSPTKWLAETTRWGQVNLNEADVLTFDTAFWVEYWKRSAIQGVTLNAGGVVAYYPSTVPHHRVARNVEQRDVFGDIVAAAKSLGLRVLARMDLSAGTPELQTAHPDWFQVRADGQPMTREDTSTAPPDRYRTAAYALTGPYFRLCPLGPYLAEFVAPIIDEIGAAYDVDAFFGNGWPLLGQGVPGPTAVCRCPHCHAAWSERHGASAGLPDAVGDDRWRSYVAMVQDAVERGQSLLVARAASAKPGATFLPVVFPVPGTGLRARTWSEQVEVLCADAQTRRTLGSPTTGPAGLWEPGLQAELLRALAPGTPVLRFYGTYSNPPLMRHAAKSPLETRLVTAVSLAHGERPKWHTLGGHSHDRRWMDPVAEFGSWMASVEAELRGRESVADVAILWSQKTAWAERWEQRDDGPAAADGLSGWYEALFLGRIPAEIVHEDRLESLDRYRVLVVPSGTDLSDEAATAIGAFHAGGGAVIASCDASLRDDQGHRRPDLALADILGLGEAVDLSGPHVHSYLRRLGNGEHPVLAGFDDTEVLAGGRWLAATPLRDTTRALTCWVPDFAIIPTNDVIMGPGRVDVTTVAVRDDGPARTAYLAMDLDAEHRRTGSPDHRRLLQNVVRWVLAGDPSITVEGEGVMDVRLWQRSGGTTVHLVNLDTPQLAGSPAVDLRPLGLQVVDVAIPRAVAAARLLRSGEDAAWELMDGGQRVRVMVPSVQDFEIVAIDLVPA